MKESIMADFILYKVPVKNICLLFLLLIVTVGLFPKRLYFDAGMGSGYVSTKHEGAYVSSVEGDYPTQQTFSGMGLDLGVRLGYMLSDQLIIVADYQSIYGGKVSIIQRLGKTNQIQVIILLLLLDNRLM